MRRTLKNDFQQCNQLSLQGQSLKQIALTLGLSRPRVSNILRLARVSAALWRAYEDGRITGGMLEELAAIELKTATHTNTLSPILFFSMACAGQFSRDQIRDYSRTMVPIIRHCTQCHVRVFFAHQLGNNHPSVEPHQIQPSRKKSHGKLKPLKGKPNTLCNKCRLQQE